MERREKIREMGYIVDGPYVRYDFKDGFRDGDCDKLLKWDLERARASAKEIFGKNITCPCAQSVVVEMVFHYGEGPFSDSRGFRLDIMRKKW